MSIYQRCGIRGEVATDLTPELYRRWGFTLGRKTAAGGKFLVAGDMRPSTPLFKKSLVEGLCLAGVDCIDLGDVPTPMVYHARRRLRAEAFAIVTGSHHPVEFNGLMWMLGDTPPGPEQVAELEAGAQQAIDVTTREASCGRTLDISFDYVAGMQETFCTSMAVHRNIVIDAMHGCWQSRARRYLHAIFPACLITVVHDTPHADFGGTGPDCARADRLHALCETVYRERADLGIAFDGDGDRLALVDGRGAPLTAEETALILLRSFGHEAQNRPFLHDQRFSDQLAIAARKTGAEPIVAPSSPARMRAQMRESQAILGAQVHGQFYFAELDGFDDSLYAACRVIACLGENDEGLDKLRRKCPKVCMTSDIRLPMDSAAQGPVVEHLRAAWESCPQTTLDGLRIDQPGGWTLVRSSATETALVFRFESTDWQSLDRLVRGVCDSVPELAEDLWSGYEHSLGRKG